MRINRYISGAVCLAVVSLFSLTGCSSTMSPRDQNTAVGAGVGAVSGAILTGGNAFGVVGGAVVGGVIGHEMRRR